MSKPPPAMVFAGNLSVAWKNWIQRYNVYMTATGNNHLDDDQQIAILLNLLGEEAIHIYNTFPETDSVKEVIKLFEAYCNRKETVIQERFKFFNAKQKPNQSVDNYILELQTLSSTCAFFERDNMCRDKLIIGLMDVGLQERLLKMDPLDLATAADFCRSFEASQQQALIARNLLKSSVDDNTAENFGMLGAKKQCEHLSLFRSEYQNKEFDGNNSSRCEKSALKTKNIDEKSIDRIITTIKEPLILNGKNRALDEVEDDLLESFPFVTLEDGDRCFIVYFKDFEHIYVCKAVYIENNYYEPHNMEIIIQTFYSEDREIETNLTVGKLVKIESISFGGIFRGIITDIIDDTHFRVFYIDYGNSETVDSINIYKLSHELQLATELPLCVSIDVPQNAIITDEINTIFNNLINGNFVLSIEFTTKNLSGHRNVNFKKDISGESVNEEVLKLFPIEKKISIKNGDKCIVTHFEDLNSIYILKYESFPELAEISQILNNCVEINSTFTVGDFAIVKSPSLQKLYRAEIMNIVDNTDIYVFYIDFGKTEKVQRENVYHISEHLKSKPGFTFKVGLELSAFETVTNKSSVNVELRLLFANLIHQQEILCIEFNDSCEKGLENCTLKIISTDLCLNNEVAKLLSPMTLTPPTENNKSSYSRAVINGGLVKILHGDNVNNIYIRSIQIYEEFNLEQLKQMRKDNLESITPKLKDVVAVYCPKHDAMTRGKIVSLESNDKISIKCILIDDGQVKFILPENIFKLPNEFSLQKVPRMAHKVILNGMMGNDYQDINSDKIRLYLSSIIDKTFILEFGENSNEWYNGVVLKDPKTNISLNQEIQNIISTQDKLNKNIVVTEKNQRKLKNISHPIISGSIVHLIIFENFDYIFIRHASIENLQKFLELHEQLNILGQTAATNKIKFNVGDTVLVKSDTFETYVRGRINKKFNMNNYEVRLIDYGHDELSVIEDLFILPKKLQELPDFAIKVQMSKPPMFENQINMSFKTYIKNKYIAPKSKFLIEFDESKTDGLNDVILTHAISKRTIGEDLTIKFCT